MLSSDLIQVSLRQLYRQKRRYRSVIIGIALGIAGLVTVFTMGDSVESDLGRNLEILGSATVLKAHFDFDRSTRWHHGQYHEKDMEDIKKLPGVRTVSPMVWSMDQLMRFNKGTMRGRVLGVDESFFETIFIPISTGRGITAADVEARNSVCVIGKTVMEQLFKNGIEPVGKVIDISGHMFQVVGLMGGVEDRSLFETVIIPISVARSRIQSMYEIREILVRGFNWDVVQTLQQEILGVLARNQPGYADAMVVKAFPERVEAIKRAVFLTKLFIYASLVVTILLGGLGITNVMLAAVRERTTEIGLRKAVGATEGMIMSQFLLEAVTISLMGAGIGMFVGFISVEVLKRLLGTVPTYEVFAASLVGGVLFGVVLGIASGYLPARKASKLDPSEAMRFE
jgi:putative ABC transport system permease protein